MITRNQTKIKTVLTLAILVMAISPMAATSQADDIFSLNFYMYPWPWTTQDQFDTITLEPDQSAGFDTWLTDGWENIEVPWEPSDPQDPVTITSNQGSEATFTLTDARNGGAYFWDQPRTTLLGDGNGDMMDGHANATEDSDSSGQAIVDFTVSDIPFGVYDVIFYIGSQEAQFGDGRGKFVFNGGAEQDFTLTSGIFDGTFTEITDSVTPGNYIIYRNLPGSEPFTVQMWGNGFNHIGLCGLQFRQGDPNAPDVNAGNDWIIWSGETVTLDPTVVERAPTIWTNLTYVWTASPDTGVVITEDGINPDDTATKEAKVEITKTADNPSPVALTLSVYGQGIPLPMKDTLIINVYDDPCLAAKGADPASIDQADFDANCITQLSDYAVLAEKWLVDYALTEPAEKL